MDPPLLDPVVDLLRDDAKFPGQVGNPPFVLLDEVIAEQLANEAQVTHQRADCGFLEDASTARWDETLVVELAGDLCEVEALAMELPDPFGETSKVFQLCISADGAGDLDVEWSCLPARRSSHRLSSVDLSDTRITRSTTQRMICFRSTADVPAACQSVATLPESDLIRSRSAAPIEAGSFARNR